MHSTTPADVTEAYFDDGDWVVCIHSTASFVGCALSSGELQFYDPRNLQLKQALRNFHGDGIITDLVGAPPQQYSDHLVASSGTDGNVCVVDLRQPASPSSGPCVSCSMPNQSNNNEEALSVSLGYDGNLAAVGTSKAKIHFYDLRQPHQPVGSYVNSHTDDVTRVRFQNFPQHHNVSTTTGLLLTGSEEGLACIFDTTQPSEEAALKYVMNTQTSLRQVGFFGPNLENIYCLTGSETLSLWSLDTAQCLADYSDIRSTLEADYLVNASWDHFSEKLSLLSGTSSGELLLSTIGANGNVHGNNGQRPPIMTSHRLAGGHKGVVRDWCPTSSNLLITVGEDARMCEWDLTKGQTSDGSLVKSPSTAIVNRKFSRRRQKNKRSAAPY